MLQAQQVLHNRYQLQEKLGQTAGRQTWLATDLQSSSSEQVIVKLLAFADQVNWETLKLFEREAAILRQLDHPQIPKYRDYFSVDDRILWFGLVQECISGASLKDLLAAGKRFTASDVHRIATEVLQILIYLHELSPSVLHRDIKPSNLMLASDQRIHLIDFGSVQDRAVVEGTTFTVVGTYGYAPMEQFGGRTVPASDLYSLGATLIHLLTGTAPADLPQKDLRIQFAHLVSAGPGFVHWIEKLVDPDVTKRSRTAREALAALQIALKPVPGNTIQRREQSVRGTIASHRPTYSRVELHSQPEQLTIQCPGESHAAMTTMGGVGLLVIGAYAAIAANFFFFPLFIFGGFLLVAGINASTITVVTLNHKRFSIHKESTFFSDRIADDFTEDIQDVIHHDLQFHNGKTTTTHRVVTIQTSIRDWSFGKQLTRPECAWLVQEIKAWLGHL